MAVANMQALAVEVLRLSGLAVAPLPVSAKDLDVDRYVRLDGYNMQASQLYKNHKTGDHTMVVHVFDDPKQGTDSLVWVNEQMELLDAALTDQTLAGLGVMQLEEASARLERRDDGKNYAHALLAYECNIGA